MRHHDHVSVSSVPFPQYTEQLAKPGSSAWICMGSERADAKAREQESNLEKTSEHKDREGGPSRGLTPPEPTG